MENRKLYTACQGKIPLRPLRAIAGAIEERRQNRRESEDNTMSIFKKPEKGFLAKLFKHKQVEELAEELAHTYADEMRADMLSENPETDTAEDTAAAREESAKCKHKGKYQIDVDAERRSHAPVVNARADILTNFCLPDQQEQ